VRIQLLVVTCSFAVLAACQPQRASGGTRAAAANVITREQIEATGASNIYDVIARLHSDFLRDRGRVSIKMDTHDRAVVFLNDQEYGIPETMRNFPAGRVEQVRFFGGSDAVARFGSQYGGGVIQLISRTQ